MVTRTMRYASDATASLRHAIADDLRGRGLAVDQIEDIVLTADELLGNAVSHGRPMDGGGVDIDWAVRDGVARVAVTDGGSAAAHNPHRKPSSTSATRGRGLAIVEALSSRWGTEYGPSGTTVWAEFAVPAAVFA